MNNTIKFRNEELSLKFGRYQDTNLMSLQLYDCEGFPYMTASFNTDEAIGDGMYDFPFTKVMTWINGIIVIKNWSENEGIEQALLENKVIDTRVGIIQTGFVYGNAYKIKEELFPKE